MKDIRNKDVTYIALGNGGLLSRFFVKTGLSRENSPSFGRRIILLTLFSWVPLLILSILEGVAFGNKVDLPFIRDVGPHARLLLSVPVFILADAVVNRNLAQVIDHLPTSGLVPPSELPRWQEALGDLFRRFRASLPDIFLMVLALAASWTMVIASGETGLAKTSSWAWTGSGEGRDFTLAALWYITVSTPIYLYLLLRWFWRMWVWGLFLLRFSRMALQLQPTHPDSCGGLGILMLGQTSFTMIFLGMGVSLSPILAHHLILTSLPLLDFRGVIAGFIAVSLFIIVAPLFLFGSHLFRTRNRGLMDYGSLGTQLSGGFGQRWTGESRTTERQLLDTPDPSAVADYGAVYEAARTMRFFPFGIRDLIPIVVVLCIPFIPLLFLEFSFTELLKKLMMVMG